MDVTFFGVPLNPLTVVKGKIIMTQVKIVRKTLFRNVVIGVDYCCKGREIELHSECDKNRWGFIAKEGVEGKVLRRDIQGRRNSCELTEFLLKASQSDQVSPKE